MRFGSMAELVDLQNGIVSRDIFVDRDIYEREQEQVFARCWLFVGHESQVPKPGDYFVSRMGEESVILTRDMQGSVHVLLNTCRHRGMKVCRYDEGNTRVFTCPYHGWTYSIDGRVVEVPGGLSGVPYYEDAYHGKLDKSQWGLIEVAQLANYKGSIWATWDSAAPSFEDYMGDMKLWLDLLLDCRDGREGGSEVLMGVQKWRLKSNWKFAAENFAGDFHHGAPTHRSVEAVGIAFGDSENQDRHGRRRGVGIAGSNDAKRQGVISFPQLGHAVRGGLSTAHDDRVPSFNDPVINDYFQHLYQERQRRRQGQLQPQGNGGNVFPNASFHCHYPRTILVSHPRGPMATEEWRWYLVDKDAPAEVKDLLRHYYMRYSGPSGMTEQDDMENWSYASEASNGVIARRYPYNYEMGLGYAVPVEGLRGAVDSSFWISEENARTLLRRWVALMDAKSWSDLPA